jgi:succinoglycan biosynthesis protein ExoW
MRQRDVEDVSVIVVDDASPVPASAEVASLGTAPRFPIRIIDRPNGGPGAARNTALDNLDSATRYVAFLDSDDEWADDHLGNASFALGRGFDFYFANLYHLNQSVSAFVRAGRIKASDFPQLKDGPEHLREYTGNMLVQIVTGNVIGTPTVVYDARRFNDVRFRPEYFNAGEDYLFWMEVAKLGGRFAFSVKPAATCGAGVNVYTGAGWGTPQHFLRIHNEMKYRKASLRQFSLPEDAAEHVRTKIKELRVAAVSDVLHRIRHGQSLDTGLLLEHLRFDPLTYMSVVPFALRKLVGARQ